MDLGDAGDASGAMPGARLRRRKAGGGKSVAAGAPHPEQPTPAEVELARRADCRLMLARGTHVRCGMSSKLRMLIGQRDLLVLIAEHAELGTIWIAEPPPSNVCSLQRQVVHEHRLAHQWRERAEALDAELHASQRRERELLRANASLTAQLEQMRARYKRRLEEEQTARNVRRSPRPSLAAPLCAPPLIHRSRRAARRS